MDDSCVFSSERMILLECHESLALLLQQQHYCMYDNTLLLSDPPTYHTLTYCWVAGLLCCGHPTLWDSGLVHGAVT